MYASAEVAGEFTVSTCKSSTACFRLHLKLRMDIQQAGYDGCLKFLYALSISSSSPYSSISHLSLSNLQHYCSSVLAYDPSPSRRPVGFSHEL